VQLTKLIPTTIQIDNDNPVNCDTSCKYFHEEGSLPIGPDAQEYCSLYLESIPKKPNPLGCIRGYLYERVPECLSNFHIRYPRMEDIWT